MRIQQASLQQVPQIVDIHLATFPGFFLSFLGPGFLARLYRGFIEHEKSELLAAVDDEHGELMGFAAYSTNLGGLYRHLLKTGLIPLAWYAFLAFLRRPSSLPRLLRALKQPKESARPEEYAILSSIGTAPAYKRKGVGSALLTTIKDRLDYHQVAYLTLETDALNNDSGNAFYLSNGFALHGVRETPEGRKMNEYRYRPGEPG